MFALKLGFVPTVLKGLLHHLVCNRVVLLNKSEVTGFVREFLFGRGARLIVGKDWRN